MSTIGGPGGVGGPEGPSGPESPDGIDDVDGAGGLDAAAGASPTAPAGELERLSAEVAAGRLTPREAIDQLVEATAGAVLDPAERAELRELLTDLVANDPYFGALAGRI